MANPCGWFAEEKTCWAKSSGWPAPGASPAIGGSAKPGLAMNGIWHYETAKPSAFFAWCTICWEEAGLWKARMTEKKFSVLGSQFSEKRPEAEFFTEN